MQTETYISCVTKDQKGYRINYWLENAKQNNIFVRIPTFSSHSASIENKDGKKIIVERQHDYLSSFWEREFEDLDGNRLFRYKQYKKNIFFIEGKHECITVVLGKKGMPFF